MLFIEWEPVISLAVAALLSALCSFGLFRTRKKQAVIAGVLAAAVFFVGALWAAVLADSATSSSAAVISPDRSMAARVIYMDEGHERDVAVEVVGRHGLSHEIVYQGGRSLINQRTLHWLDAKNLWLAGLDPSSCRSIDSVAVHCGRANSPAAPNGPIVLTIYLTDPKAQAPSPPPDPPSESRSAR